MAEASVIVGIHGLANKPPMPEKGEWWKSAIIEGLQRNCGKTTETLPFDFVYWGCAEQVWNSWRDSDRGIIYRRWHGAARDFGANSGFGLGFFCALAGSRHTAGVIRPMTGEGALP